MSKKLKLLKALNGVLSIVSFFLKIGLKEGLGFFSFKVVEIVEGGGFQG
jgi:hypothetical protein